MPLLDHPNLLFVVASLVLFLFSELGFRLALRVHANADEDHHEQLTSIRDSLAVLLSLLLAFMMAIAVPRFEERRQMAVQDANAIGTAGLRAQLLPEPQRSRVLSLLRDYAGNRIDLYRDLTDRTRFQQDLLKSEQLHNAMWEQTVAACTQDRSAVCATFVVAMNEVIDMYEKRRSAVENRIPRVIWYLIAFIAVLTSTAFGFSAKKRRWFSLLAVPLAFAALAALIADLDSPRSGFIKVSQASMHRTYQGLNGGVDRP